MKNSLRIHKWTHNEFNIFILGVLTHPLLLSKFCSATTEGVSLLGINTVASNLKLQAYSGRLDIESLCQAPLPCILHWNQNHFVVLYKVKNCNTFYVADPGKGLVAHIDQKVRFTRGELTYGARRVEIFHEDKRPVVILTNNFDFSVEYVSEIYRLRWAIILTGCYHGASYADVLH